MWQRFKRERKKIEKRWVLCLTLNIMIALLRREAMLVCIEYYAGTRIRGTQDLVLRLG